MFVLTEWKPCRGRNVVIHCTSHSWKSHVFQYLFHPTCTVLQPECPECPPTLFIYSILKIDLENRCSRIFSPINLSNTFSHLYKRMRPSVRPSSWSWIWKKAFLGWFWPKNIRNIKLCHQKDDSETSTRSNRQNASVVWKTLSDLFLRV